LRLRLNKTFVMKRRPDWHPTYSAWTGAFEGMMSIGLENLPLRSTTPEKGEQQQAVPGSAHRFPLHPDQCGMAL